MATNRRIESIDYWRGLALLIIFIDHVPGNPIALLTPRNFGFSDATELFIFLSGMVLSYVYWPKIQAGETRRVASRCLRRAAQLYTAQIAIVAAVMIIFGTGYLLTHKAALLELDGRNEFFASPISSTIGMFTLGFQLGYVNILPVYIVLLFMAPLLMMLLRRSMWLGLSVSSAVYGAARLGLQLPSWPWPNTWFLDPFAWQFLFTLGLVAGIRRRASAESTRSTHLLIAAAAVVVVAFIVEKNGFGFWPSLSANIADRFDTNKQWLGLGRLVHFLALAYIAVHFDLGTRLRRLPGARQISQLGRNGLTIFTAGSIFSAFGQLGLDLFQSDDYFVVCLAGVVIVSLGILALILVVHLVERKNTSLVGFPKAIASAVFSPVPAVAKRVGRPPATKPPF